MRLPISSHHALSSHLFGHRHHHRLSAYYYQLNYIFSLSLWFYVSTMYRVYVADGWLAFPGTLVVCFCFWISLGFFIPLLLPFLPCWLITSGFFLSISNIDHTDPRCAFFFRRSYFVTSGAYCFCSLSPGRCGTGLSFLSCFVIC